MLSYCRMAELATVVEMAQIEPPSCLSQKLWTDHQWQAARTQTVQIVHRLVEIASGKGRA